MITKYTLLLFLSVSISSCQSGFFAKKTVNEPTDAPVSVNKPTPEEDLKSKPMAPMSSEAIFDRLVAKTEDGQVKKDLLAYKAEGNIAKKVDMKGTTPDDLINTAREYLGTPHKMGGTSKRGIDCSGLLHVVFSKYNIDLPHNSHEISRFGKMVANKKRFTKRRFGVFYTHLQNPSFHYPFGHLRRRQQIYPCLCPKRGHLVGYQRSLLLVEALHFCQKAVLILAISTK